jgi:Mg-chelatase subunit ChlD
MTQTIHKRRGAMLVLVAVVLVILLVGAVFSIDVAYMHVVRAELRTATDAAARAGSEELARTQDLDAARAAAIAIAEQNQVAGIGLSLDPNDIIVGTARDNRRGRFTFIPNETPLTAVRVTGRRANGSPDGPVNLFFARVFATNTFQPVESATASANVRDVALVLDISGSMSSPSGGGTRLSALKEAVEVFLDEVESSSPSTQISLTSYSTTPTKRINLTDDFRKIQKKVDNFRPGGWTAIGNALLVGSDSLVDDARARVYAAKTIVLMTDGNHNTGPSPTVTVQTAVDRDQQVHTITFSSGANQPLMQQVASATDGGIHLHADDAADLAAAFREIARSLAVVLVE